MPPPLLPLYLPLSLFIYHTPAPPSPTPFSPPPFLPCLHRCSTWLEGLGDDGEVFKAGSLPSVKGSRQMTTVELATYVVLNRRGFLRYLRQNSANKRLEGSKVRDANQLIKCAVAGLQDHFVVCGMLARAMFFVSIGNLARYLLNTFGTRHNLYNVFDDVGNAINDILEAGGVLNEEGHSCLRRRVLRRCPAWQEKLERWEQKTGNREMGRSVCLEINTDHNRAWVASYW